MNLVFIPGGPGLNSNPERHLFKKDFEYLFSSVYFFDEPSSIRGDCAKSDYSYQNYLKSLVNFFEENIEEEPSVIVAHSFGVFGAIHLASRNPQSIKGLLLIAPNLDLFHADHLRFQSTLKEYLQHKELEKHKTLLKKTQSLSPRFDQSTIDAFNVLVQNERLFTSYFSNSEVMEKVLLYYTEEGFTFDYDSFLAVRQSIPSQYNPLKISVSTVAIFGDNDPIIDSNKEIPLLQKTFSQLETFHFSDCGHFPHHEDKEKFLVLLKKLKS